ncbi:MAG: YncE family protein [Nostocoides sp.]
MSKHPPRVRRDRVYVWRRWIAALLFVSVAAFGVHTAAGLIPDHAAAGLERATATAQVTTATPVAKNTPAPKTTPTPTTTTALGSLPSATTRLVRVDRLTGGLSPKSVVASVSGQVFAQNMMYTHTITVFSADRKRLATIDDGVELAAYGVTGHPGTSRGAPVEMAFSPDGRTAWVSNYAMYGSGFLPEGSDACRSSQGISDSYVYEIDTATYSVKRVVRVGATPKYVAMTPDGKHVLVTNWCSMTLSVIDTGTARVVATIATTGRNPRGIVVSPDSRTAYVAVMGSGKVVAIDLQNKTVRDFAFTGAGPRHIVISPDGRTLYVTNDHSGTVSEVDRATGKIRRSVRVHSEPRSMTISPDGTALYVVNYSSAKVSKIRTSDMTLLQDVATDGMPIGITYEPTKKAVWVACYGGSILVYDDTERVSAG